MAHYRLFITHIHMYIHIYGQYITSIFITWNNGRQAHQSINIRTRNYLLHVTDGLSYMSLNQASNTPSETLQGNESVGPTKIEVTKLVIGNVFQPSSPPRIYKAIETLSLHIVITTTFWCNDDDIIISYTLYKYSQHKCSCEKFMKIQ